MAPRKRADRLLVDRGLFESRAKAQAAILAGGVIADGVVVVKPSDEIAIDAAFNVEPAHPWVSRGGVKLAAALDRFRFDPTSRICLDIGASTGGFTDVLLARGAQRVYAVDVGREQLHARLRGRPEVVSMETTDIRRLDAKQLSEHPDLIVIDVSFISLKLVLPAAIALAAARFHLIALIKPQFETGGRNLKKGVVRDPAVQAAVCAEITVAAHALGLNVIGVMPSPIVGGDGNQEFLLGASRD